MTFSLLVKMLSTTTTSAKRLEALSGQQKSRLAASAVARAPH
jgi:hypothetical protein